MIYYLWITIYIALDGIRCPFVLSLGPDPGLNLN